MNPWTDERIELLKQLHADQQTASYMARELSNGVVISRSAVLGRLHRMGLKSTSYSRRGRYNRNESLAQRAERRQKLTKLVQPAPPVVPGDAPQALHLGLLELKDGHCRFPFGDGPVTFCGHQRHEPSPYCQFHHRVTHNG